MCIRNCKKSSCVHVHAHAHVHSIILLALLKLSRFAYVCVMYLGLFTLSGYNNYIHVHAYHLSNMHVHVHVQTCIHRTCTNVQLPYGYIVYGGCKQVSWRLSVYSPSLCTGKMSNESCLKSLQGRGERMMP